MPGFRDYRLSIVAAFLAAAMLFACGGNSGGGAPSGALTLLEASLIPGQTLPVNAPIWFRLDKPVLLSSANLESIQIQALPPASLGAPVAGAVTGSFFLDPNDNRVVIFQPTCPSTAQGSDGGLIPGNAFGAVVYQVSLSAGAGNSVLQGLDGSRLAQGSSFLFQTPLPPMSALLDPKPGSPPSVVSDEGIPGQLSLNLALEPAEPFFVPLDQPVLASSIDNDSVRIEFEHPLTHAISRVPAHASLIANCTTQGGANLVVVPLGVLPAGQTLHFLLSKNVLGFSSEGNDTDVLFHSAYVDAAALPQLDAILETFLDDSLADADPAVLDPPAAWGGGELASGTLYPGAANQIDVEIGPGTTNGVSVVFSTDGGNLRDTNGNLISFPDGVIELRSLRLKSPIAGGKSEILGVGSKPLRIRAWQKVVVESGALISLNGQNGQAVATLNTPNLPQPGGAGVCGGGDGGDGSPSPIGSDPKGGDGDGPYQAPGGGGKGGESGYGWVVELEDNLGGGGGGGNWGLMELDASGNYVSYCYAATPCSLPGCPLPPAGCQDVTCFGPSASPTTQGEAGASGPHCVNPNQSNPICDLGGANNRICQRGAVMGSCLAQGGAAGAASFVDGNPANDFLGRKATIASGRVQISHGELTSLLGGRGGGGAGDTVVSSNFPSSSFLLTDFKGGPGGGGGGTLSIEALDRLEIRGALRANGGSGGEGEQAAGGSCGASGGGGGSGGMIFLECAGQTIIGKGAKIEAIGGNRAQGCFGIPGQVDPSGGSYCRKNLSAGHGGAGGKGPTILAVPFDGASTNSCGGSLRPVIRANALLVENSNNVLVPISCERDPLLTARADPDLQVVLSHFGPRSACVSRWIHLGWVDLAGPPQYGFGGLDANGAVQSGFAQTLAAGSASEASMLPDGRVQLDAAALADAIRSQPLVLREDGFQPDMGAVAVRITNATVSGSMVTLSLDAASAGSIGTINSWRILRRFFATTVQGTESVYPLTAKATILFEGADELEAGGGIPNPASILGPTATIANLAGKKLLRFQVQFDRSTLPGAPLTPDLPEIGLRFLKIPYSF